MPRYSMKSVMIACAVLALWCSTVVGYAGADDMRKFIVLLGLSACFVTTYCSTGRRKSFWFAFTVFFFLSAVAQSLAFPSMMSLSRAIRPLVTSIDIYGDMQNPAPSMIIVEFFADTVRLAIDVALATLAGVIGGQIYDNTRAVA